MPLYIGKDKGSFEKLYNKISELFERTSLNLPSEKILKKTIKKTLEDEKVKSGLVNKKSKFKDMQDYIRILTKDWKVESVLDNGVGKKGVVAQHYWENVNVIKRGYACDIWVLKELPPLWKPLLMDALNLLDVLQEKSIDVVQAFGFLEHLTKDDGLKFLKIAEKLAKRLVIVSAATCIHTAIPGQECGDDPDYKVKMDGNVNHRYNSTWQWAEFEDLGYTSNLDDKIEGITFNTEAIAWKVMG